MKNRILVQTFPNPTIREFHSTWQISEARSKSFERPLRDSSTPHLKEIGDPGTKMIQDLFAITGITEVLIKLYSARIYLGAAFAWEDVQASILDVLKASCPPDVSADDIEVTGWPKEDARQQTAQVMIRPGLIREVSLEEADQLEEGS
ncbi:MAG: hypothetical protein JWM56_1230 [Candidatus Peribacteria bacterium]|nr:hypothetical protein [Candidatus Peribacteria bacterium]